MVRKRITEITGGERVAQDIRSEEKKLIMPKGTVIKKEYVELLAGLGVQELYIESESPVDKENEQFVGRMQNQVRQMQEQHICGQSNLYAPVESLAQELIDHLTERTVSEQGISRSRDPFEHTVWVAIHCYYIARELQIEETQQKELVMAALIHDLGLRYITYPYLDNNPEEGNPQDIFDFKNHTILGYTALEQEAFSKEVKELVLFHHEHSDGSGYPLKRKKLSVVYEILQCVNEYDCKKYGLGTSVCSQQELEQYFQEKQNIYWRQEVVEKVCERMSTSMEKDKG